MIFAHSGWLVVGIAACLGALWTWRRYDARQRKALEAFVSPHLGSELTRSISVSRRRLKRGLFIAAIALLFAALAEPQAGFHWEQVKRRGNDIIFAVDTSRSMLTPDVKPNRLVRAKLAIDDVVSRLDGDAVGLVAFAGSAFLQCPLTLDYGAFHESLAALDTHIIPRGGTDISSAIRAAQSALHNRAGSDKVLILVTDGEDLEGDALDTAKAAFRQDGLKIYTVGVGSANGDLIPLPADQGGGFLKDNEGRFVRSRLDEPALKALAQATGGSYAPLGAQNQGLEVIYAQALAPLAKHDLESRTEKVYIERYQWPLALCLVCLLSSLLVGTRRRAPSPGAAVTAPGDSRRARTASATGAATLACAAFALLLAAAGAARASPASAASAYQRGDFSKAQRDYSEAAAHDPSQPVLKFDAGTAAYKAGDYPVAAREFQSSLDAAKSGSAQRLAEQQDAYYNLGNTLYRQGQKTEKSDAGKTIEAWAGAVKAYDAALQLRADDADSKYNRELVNRKLEQLKKQQQSKQQQSQSQQQQSQNQNQGGSKDQSPGSSGNSSASQQPKNPNNGQPSGADRGQSQQAQSQSQQSQGQPQQAQGQPQQAQGQPQQSQGQPQQPQGQPQPGDIRASAGNTPQTSQNRGGTGTGQEQRVPGEMSPEEARELLDSVKDEERRAPTAPSAGNSEAIARPDESSKDW